MISYLWSWRDSNPRPNRQYASFLHAYSVFGFRPEADNRPPTSGLSSKDFRALAEASKALFSHYLCPGTHRSETELWRDILFPYYTSGKVLILLNFRLSSKSKLFVAS